ncbi:MAG TPA: DegT/DnrJ/EryC1/StrS family aminotransferase [Candidatus Limnocylindrales bacterium]|nr:DegT/DnrJ/EryC1/StrS family aminotransferase [Candidatus Limnocylindrales bacterium]
MTSSTTGTKRATVRINVPLPPHDIDAFLADARQIIESGWLAGGEHVAALERELEPWTGHRPVIAVTTATNGLIAAMTTLGEPGAEAIVPSYTFLATWQTVLWSRMVPVVADVDERGLLDPSAVAAAITDRTRVIVPVHLAGMPAPTDELRDLARQNGAALVVDAAHALGSRHADRPVGADGDAEVFSISSTKPLGAGEGGFVTARDDELEQALRRFAFYGGRPGLGDTYGPGLNLRVPELTAALARRNLERFEAQLERRSEIHRRYATGMEGLPLRLSGPLAGQRSAHKDQLVWLDDPADRSPLVEQLTDAAVETRLYHSIAIPDLTAFEGRVSSTDRGRDLAKRTLAIPMHGRLTDDEVDHVVDTMHDYFQGGR